MAATSRGPENEPLPLVAPLSIRDVESLRVGDRVLLSGVVYGARDAAHRRIVDALERGEKPPIPLEDQVIYYVGPAPARPGEVIGPAGPTTASRMDDLTAPLLERGLRAMVGKGKRSPAVRDELREHRAVYLVAVGGAAALLAGRIRRQEVVAYPDLGTEAVRRLEVENFPLVVANDVHGGDLFESGRRASRRPGAGGERPA